MWRGCGECVDCEGVCGGDVGSVWIVKECVEWMWAVCEGVCGADVGSVWSGCVECVEL